MFSASRANTLNIFINKVFNEIIDETLKYYAKGRKSFAHEMSHKDLFVLTDRWEKQLRLVTRDLNSLEHGAMLQFNQVKGKSGFEAHRGRQSATDRLKVIKSVQANANQAMKAVFDLVSAMRGPTDREWIDGLNTIISNTEKFSKQIQELKSAIQKNDPELFKAMQPEFIKIESACLGNDAVSQQSNVALDALRVENQSNLVLFKSIVPRLENIGPATPAVDTGVDIFKILVLLLLFIPAIRRIGNK